MNMHRAGIRLAAILPFLFLCSEAFSAGNCLSCHEAIGKRRFLHGPVGVKMCSTCHVKEQPSAKHHKFELAKPEPGLCYGCHEDAKTAFEAFPVKHQALEVQGCTGCHDPHGSDDRFFMKQASMDKTCAGCHEPKTTGKVVHKPVGTSCLPCHQPHGGTKEKLLKDDLPGLCIGCHKEMGTVLTDKNVHEPVKKGCASCHDAHSSSHPNLLKADGKKELCLGCHQAIAKEVRAAKVPHPAVEKDGCTACHTPHTSNHKPLLKKDPAVLCAGCHKTMGKTLKGPHRHGPVQSGQCGDCHGVHGSQHPILLKTFFPEKFYNPYKDGLYALCFQCHEKDIAKQAQTLKLTNFRNGNLNLHFVHVNSEKGRSCKACHGVHAGTQAKHVRPGVPFGSWDLPIHFDKTRTGGSCEVGCHSPKAYDRERPVSYQ